MLFSHLMSYHCLVNQCLVTLDTDRDIMGPESDLVSEGGPGGSPMSMSRTNQWRGWLSLTGDPGVERVEALWPLTGRAIPPATVLSLLRPGEALMTISGCGETFQMLVRVKRNVRVRWESKKEDERVKYYLYQLINIIISAIVFALQLSDVPKSQNIKCFKLLLWF